MSRWKGCSGLSSSIGDESRRLIIHFAQIPQGRPSGVGSVIHDSVLAQRVLPDTECRLVIATARDLDDRFTPIAEPARCVFSAIGALRTHGAEKVAVLHGVYAPQIVLIGMLLWLLRIPYVVVAHGAFSEATLQKSPRKKAVWRIIALQPLIRGARGVQYLSEGERAASVLSTKRDFIVPNFVSIPDREKQWDTNDAGPVYLYLGRFDIHHKGLDLLIEAAGEIADILRERSVSIHLVGPDHGGSGDVIRKLVRDSGVTDIVRIRPAVSGEAKEAEFLGADCFLHTSRYEGEPTAVLEAMSYGLPVLVTRGTNMYTQVRDGDFGWVCETNAEQVREAILRSLDETESWSEKGDRGRQWIIQNRSAVGIVEAQVNSYFG